MSGPQSTPLPTEPGWYWFKGRVHVGNPQSERDALLPVEVKGRTANGHIYALFNGVFASDYAPCVGEFQPAVLPWDD